MSENLLSNVLAEVYPLAEIEDVGKTKETGDIMMLRKNKPKSIGEARQLTGMTPAAASILLRFVKK